MNFMEAVNGQLQDYLDDLVLKYNRPAFIEEDPIVIPHQYRLLQDIEITGLWTAVLAWGQRKTIINKARELFQMMDQAPYDFIMNHSEDDLKPLLKFKHRTFNATDTLYFIHFFRYYYNQYHSLEQAFLTDNINLEAGLVHFHHLFCSLPEFPQRTRKHIPTPIRKSACKRINMFLRWMVRQDSEGVDFGLWHQLKPSQLICPCDLHVDRVGRRLGLIDRKQTDWITALELTEKLKKFDPADPVKYDFALFGLGVMEKSDL
ncbi:MAG: TIGR02757 family protein [Candidatus Cyclobacteriaceae bacterium M3_2C_046]